MRLYLIRHGVSCTNLLRQIQGNNSLNADHYIDPELTEEGRQTAKRLSPYILKKIKGPFVIGASKLLRAQQTAHLLLKPKQLFIVPHISELQRESMECTALPPELQARTLIERTGDKAIPPIRDYSYFEDDMQNSEDQQVKIFLNWLGQNGSKITDNGKKSLVLVSHSLFMDQLVREIKNKESGGILNYEMLELNVQIKNGKAKIQSIKRVPYVDKKKLMWSTRKHLQNNRCRIPIRKHHRTYKNGS
jgi:broad specificity phosphatase PhoE